MMAFPRVPRDLGDLRRHVPHQAKLGPGDSDVKDCGSREPGFEVIVQGGRFNYPSKSPKDASLVQAASAALSAEGIAPVCRYARWALDAGFFRRHDVDAIMLGPGDEALAHTDGEMVSLHDLEVAAGVYVRIMRAMDGREEP